MTLQAIEEFIRKQKVAFIGSIDEDGFPNIKAMFAPRKSEPGRIDDPDYCVLKFTTLKGRWYQKLKKGDFTWN